MDRKRLVTAALGILCMVPASAHAAQFKLNPPRVPQIPRYSATYDAAPGEANQVNLAFAPDGHSITLTDPGAVITASGDGCTQPDVHTVVCVPPYKLIEQEPPNDPDSVVESATVHLGDGDDTYTVSAYPANEPYRLPWSIVYGDDGNDTITGDEAEDTIDGGEGDDQLSGGAGASADTLDGGLGSDHLDGGDGPDKLNGGGGGVDTLLGGEGNDVLADGDGATQDADVLDGGPGKDGATYKKDVGPATIDLLATGGEADQLPGIENVVGTPQADTITGSDTNNVIRSNGGTDTILGNGGDDDLYGPAANIDGGAGTDRLVMMNTGKPVCGDDSDTVFNPPNKAPIPLDCEFEFLGPDPTVSFREGFRFAPNPVAADARRIVMSPGCVGSTYFAGSESQECRGRLRLAIGNKIIGTARFKGDAQETGSRPLPRVAVRLTRAGRRAAPGALVHAEIRTDAAVGHRYAYARWTFLLP